MTTPFLLPCPFCGQPPREWDTLDGRKAGTCYTPRCPAGGNDGNSADRWNTRATVQSGASVLFNQTVAEVVANAIAEERARIVGALEAQRSYYLNDRDNYYNMALEHAAILVKDGEA